MNYRFRFFIFCMLGVCYSQQISSASSCLEAVNGGLRTKILKDNGSVREEYVGREGYARFAEKYVDGQMRKAFMNVSAVLGGSKFKELGWQQFQGTVSEFRALRSKIFKDNGSVREEYVGREGYARFAEQYMNGQMLKAFINVSAVLDESEFAKLGWQGFQGTVSEFRAFRDKILNKEGSVREEYVGMEGCARFAERYMDGKMLKTFMNVSAVLDGSEFAKLSWQSFQGTVAEFRAFRDKILNKEGSVREEYVGMDGSVRFAEQYMNGQMLKAFINVSAVLDKSEFAKLGWQQFQGTVSEFRALRSKILNKEGSVREEYVGMEGYARFAKQYMDGQMQKAFKNVSAVLDESEFAKLGWQGFQGTVAEFRAFRDKILNKEGSVREEYVGMDGSVRFAEQYMNGQMLKAFQNVSAVLDESEFAKLGWQGFQGTVAEFRAFRGKILNKEGSVREEYVGREGYARFAEQYMNGQMQKAFKNVSAVLDESEFAKLGWKQFQGTAVQFHALLEDFSKHYPEGYKDLKGQQRLADQIFKGDMLKTYRNVSVLRGYFFEEGKEKDGKFIKNREFRALDWIRQ